MKFKSILLLTAAVGSLTFASCSDSKPPASNKPSANAEVKKGVAPIADNEIAVIEMENSSTFGTVKIELYSNIAPLMVARFKDLAKEGFYNGVSFHRINQMVVQGGDPNSKDADPTNDGQGNSTKPNVPAEFSDIPYERGIVGAARLGGDVNSQNCQFFITLTRVRDFDNKYTIFGKVIEGMDNVTLMSGVPKQGERPTDAVKIKTIRIEPKS